MRIVLLTFLISLLLNSCNTNDPKVISYKLEKKDFRESIQARGDLQTINTYIFKCPRVSASNISVLYLEDEGNYVKKGDTVCVLTSPDLLSYIDEQKIWVENSQAEMIKLEADNALNISLLQGQIEANSAAVALNSLDSIQQKFAPPVKQKLFELELQKANIAKSKLRNKLAAQQSIDNAEIRAMKSQIARTENQLQILTDQLNSLTLTAQFDGIVTHVVNPTALSMSNGYITSYGGEVEINSAIRPNNPVIQMPDLSAFQLAVQVPEIDFKRIVPGQKVYITIEALTNLKTTGVVKRKALVGTTRYVEVKVKTFEIIISIDSCHSKLLPGLSADCDILVNEIKDAVVIPILALFNSDSSKFVYVSEGERYTRYPVVTGLSNSSECIITSGLRGTETIALMEPPFNMIVSEKNRKNIPLFREDSIKADTSKKNPIVTKL